MTRSDCRAAIPPHQISALDLYEAGGYWPGYCLAALLADSWAAGIDYADPETLKALPALLEYIRRHMPPLCWGSWERMADWAAERQSEMEGALETMEAINGR